MSEIILTTLNARYSHASIGLRCLYANLGELQERTTLLEFVINDYVHDVVEKLLQHQASIIGIGVYIWNATQVVEIVHILKKIAPDIIIVLGGPEVSYSPIRLDFSQADYIIEGEGELAFPELCHAVLDAQPPSVTTITATKSNFAALKLPYQYYTDEDVAHRCIYIEASRGCPFQCEFCLSSMDNQVRHMHTEQLLLELEQLWQRGVRAFKFVDRTFNLNIKVAILLLDYFLSKEAPYFVHFEVIPDHFPTELRERISRFPPASLQLEVGIQSLNPKVTATIKRKLKIEKVKENINFLSEQTQAHMHLDLIVGLPGETLQSFAQGLDQLCAWSGCEIQIGMLKKLSGTRMFRHDEGYGMVYADKPPYELLQNNHVSFADMQRMKRFSRFWDLTYNSGNFKQSIRLVWQDNQVFHGFDAFSQWVYEQTNSTWKISLDRLAKLLFDYLTVVKHCPEKEIGPILVADILHGKGRKLPSFLRPYAPIKDALNSKEESRVGMTANKRQQRHLVNN